eukprot:3969723-Prymnesium_polylepis.1
MRGVRHVPRRASAGGSCGERGVGSAARGSGGATGRSEGAGATQRRCARPSLGKKPSVPRRHLGGAPLSMTASSSARATQRLVVRSGGACSAMSQICSTTETGSVLTHWLRNHGHATIRTASRSIAPTCAFDSSSCEEVTGDTVGAARWCKGVRAPHGWGARAWHRAGG